MYAAGLSKLFVGCPNRGGLAAIKAPAVPLAGVVLGAVAPWWPQGDGEMGGKAQEPRALPFRSNMGADGKRYAPLPSPEPALNKGPDLQGRLAGHFGYRPKSFTVSPVTSATRISASAVPSPFTSS